MSDSISKMIFGFDLLGDAPPAPGKGVLGAVLTPGHLRGCSCLDCWRVFIGWKPPVPGIYWTRTSGKTHRVEIVRR